MLKSDPLLGFKLFKLYCPKCGRENPDSAVFCQQCGADLKQSSTSAPAPEAAASSGSNASFQITSAFKNAIDLVKNPTGFMNANRDNDVPLKTLMINYVAILAAIPFIATLIGDAWFYGIALGAGGVGIALGVAILTYVLDIVEVFVVGFIIWKLAPNFSTTTTQVKATRLAAYAFTPAFLLAIFDIIPFLGFLEFIGLLYGLYILYLGLPILMSTPKEKALTYVIVVVIATIIVYAVIAAIIFAVVAALFATALGLFFL